MTTKYEKEHSEDLKRGWVRFWTLLCPNQQGLKGQECTEIGSRGRDVPFPWVRKFLNWPFQKHFRTTFYQFVSFNKLKGVERKGLGRGWRKGGGARDRTPPLCPPMSMNNFFKLILFSTHKIKFSWLKDYIGSCSNFEKMEKNCLTPYTIAYVRCKLCQEFL